MTASHAQSCTEIFTQHVPRHFLAGLPQVLDRAYSQSLQLLGESMPYVGTALSPAANNAYPYLRLTLIEYGLHEYCSRWSSSGLSSRWCQLEANRWNYLEITAGPIVMTVSATDSLADAPRRAEYRNAYAERAQTELWEDSAMPVGSIVYAILLHGAVSRLKSGPDFAGIRFVDQRGRLVGEPIQLRRAGAPEIAPSLPAAIEEVPDRTSIKIRPAARVEDQ